MTKFVAIAFAFLLPLVAGCTGGDEKDSDTTDSAVVAE